ncbi:CAP domain-containing protein [Rhodovulum sp. YNF3179]|uniref:CAP domain-containing protein n=1 Tax=Rhodovulum sp. YNF3179 TaxID=3425127 RepID=UPI003D32BD1D
MRRVRLLWAAAALAVMPVGAAPAAEDVTGALLAEVNAVRAAQGRAPLEPDAALARTAAGHADALVASGGFSHLGPDGSSLADRLDRTGYGPCRAAENLAQGQRGAAEVVGDWLESRGHRRNLLHPDLTELGAARGAGDLWVLVMGRPGC